MEPGRLAGALRRIARRLDKRHDEYKAAAKMVSVEKKQVRTTADQVIASVGAQEIVQTVAEGMQNRAHQQIASVVSRCLEAVFHEPYNFQIQFEKKRGRTEARLVFVRDKLEVDPMTAAGGGVVDVAAFALRLACLVLAKPARRRLLVLDEPFKFVSELYRARVRDLMLELAEEMDVQFVIVTHVPDFEIGKVVEL